MRPFEAALKGAREIGFTIVSITFSLIAVFIPVLLMGGMVGRVFREFAVTIAVAIIVSGFVSLTLTPMLCARVLRGASRRRARSRIFVLRGFEAMFDGMAARLRMVARPGARSTSRSCWWSRFATHRRHGLALHRHPEGLLPDRGHRLHARRSPKAPTDISFQAMVERQRKVAEIVRKDPAVDYRQFDGRRRRSQSDRQLRPHAASRSSRRAERGQLDRRDPAAAPHGQRGAGHGGVLPDDPEHQRRRPHQQERVPVHAAVERHRGALPGRAGAARQDRAGRRACATSPPISTSRIRR